MPAVCHARSSAGWVMPTASGGGSGPIPALTGDTSVLKEFPNPVDQVTWVALGSAGYLAKNIESLPGGMEVKAGMPAWQTALTPDELMSVVLHERSTLNTEAFDIKKWEKGFEEGVKEPIFFHRPSDPRPEPRKPVTGSRRDPYESDDAAWRPLD